MSSKPHRSPGIAASRAAAWEWRCRFQFEEDSALRFTRLAKELELLGFSDSICSLAKQAADDEKRHAELCLELVLYFGGERPELSEHKMIDICPPELSASQRLTYELVAMSCVTETLSCAILGVLLERASDQKVKAVVQSILKDEVNHSRLGWAYLTEISGRNDVSFLSPYLSRILSGTVTEEIFQASATGPLEEQMVGLGALQRSQRLELFVSCMKDLVFPGLERFGVSTQSARDWLLQHST